MPDDGAALARIERKLDLLLARSERRADPAVADFLRAVDAVWGNGPWRAGELIQWAADQTFSGRAAVLVAARNLLALAAGAVVSPHRLGLRLSALADSDVGDLRLVREGAKERGARLWAVVRVRD